MDDRKNAASKIGARIKIRSDSPNAFRLQALQISDSHKPYALPFVERSHGGGENRRLMDKDFPASVAENDPIAFRIIEPLDASLFHDRGS